ncbi:hypothetical protein [Bradyrhizobium viridifuturi]|uniref:hypothetical protein n=1 Tax=Bradyrhizobium viridifuturi TaxID=1654716 RepID=UPI000A469D94|nr:hypothetical protein [Bradyrhizobium viridifuturi]
MALTLARAISERVAAGRLADRPGIPRDDARFAYPRRTGVQGPDDLTDRLFRVDIPE